MRGSQLTMKYLIYIWGTVFQKYRLITKPIRRPFILILNFNLSDILNFNDYIISDTRYVWWCFFETVQLKRRLPGCLIWNHKPHCGTNLFKRLFISSIYNRIAHEILFGDSSIGSDEEAKINFFAMILLQTINKRYIDRALVMHKRIEPVMHVCLIIGVIATATWWRGTSRGGNALHLERVV